MSSMPRRFASSRASGSPWRVSWSVRAKASRPGVGHPPDQRRRRVEAVGDRGVAVEVDLHAGRIVSRAPARIEFAPRGAVPRDHSRRSSRHGPQARRHGPRLHAPLDGRRQDDPLRLSRQEERRPAVLSARLLARLLGRDQAVRRDAAHDAARATSRSSASRSTRSGRTRRSPRAQGIAYPLAGRLPPQGRGVREVRRLPRRQGHLGPHGLHHRQGRQDQGDRRQPTSRSRRDIAGILAKARAA